MVLISALSYHTIIACAEVLQQKRLLVTEKTAGKLEKHYSLCNKFYVSLYMQIDIGIYLILKSTKAEAKETSLHER